MEKRIQNKSKIIHSLEVISSMEDGLLYARSILEAEFNPMLVLNCSAQITDLNEAFLEASGLPKRSLLGSDFSLFFTHPKLAKQCLQSSIEKGWLKDYPLNILHQDGRVMDVLFSASVYKNKQGQVLGIIAVANDVTAKNKVELALNKSVSEISGYKRALDESSIVAITDAKGIIQYANDNFCLISKYKREELIGRDHRIVNSAYHPKAFMAEFWAHIQRGEIWRGEIKNRAKDGTAYWVDTTVVPFVNEAGKIYQYVSIRTDITAKKLLSQYAISLIEASRDPLVTISIDGKITDMNEAMLKFIGIEREQMRGSDFIKYFEQAQLAEEVYQTVFQEGFVTDHPLTMNDEKHSDVLINGSVYKDDRGNVLGAVMVARDISEQKRIEKELIEAKVYAELATAIAEEAKTKAESAVAAKQQFLSNMSHEIRTPMNAIIGFTKVAMKTELTEKQREYLQAIKISGDALIVLINDILDLAKVDAGKMVFEQIPFKLNDSIASMLHLFEAKIHEKNLRLMQTYDAGIPLVLLGDPVRLHQILINLLSNAVKFTAQGQIALDVELLSENDEKVEIAISITDTGLGIPDSEILNIFENFQQANSSTSRVYGGTGLGLAIVKQLVESQGGRIQVESMEGQGSCFKFVLPFLKTNMKAEVEIPVLESNLDPSNIKILVVEDMPLNQLLMRTVLDDFGYGCDIASNGKLAIDKLQKDTYDLVLMDLQMPEMNGFEATAYIREVLKLNIPIIALTADVTTVDLAKCKSVGMDDYLAKPVNENLLHQKIHSLIVKRTIQSKPEIAKDFINKETRYTNLDYLTQRTKSDPLLMVEMIGLYLEQTPPMLEAMNLSLRNKDWSLLQATMHKILPSFSIMGIHPEFEGMAKKIHAMANEQEQGTIMFEMVQRLEEVCLSACKELQVELNLIKKNIEK